MIRPSCFCFVVAFVFVISSLAVGSVAFAAPVFKAGVARCDITPVKPMPMWGYGARHMLLSQGTRDPLFAKALVLDTGTDKLALVSLDLGRSPTAPMMERIRKAVKDTAGVQYLMVVGTHTHHGPVIELRDEPGKGKDKFDDAVAYARDLEAKIVQTVAQAADKAQDAKIGWASESVPLNRNRHTQVEPKPVDSELAVVRFDDLNGKPIATIVNFAAHPTNINEMDLRFSADYPGQLAKTVEEALGGMCLFMQGAAGDLSCNKGELNSVEAFGKALGEKAIAIAKDIDAVVPASPSLKGMDDDMPFKSRINMQNPLVQEIFKQAFFPELIVVIDEYPDSVITAHLTTVLINNQLGLVGGSGEFFCNHAIRLKERARGIKILFFGYCNGHNMYFPTIEATAEGGYGAEITAAWVPAGAGEQMMDKALINLYTMMGKYTNMLLPSVTPPALNK